MARKPKPCRPRRIALVGTASSGVGAPYGDPAFEIWGVSKRARYVSRADRWFELHRLDGEPAHWAASWRKELKADSTDIGALLMMWPEPGLHHNVKPYPYDRIAARFGTYFKTSTFSWMMALAIDELRPLDAAGVCHPVKNGDEVAIYGIDMEAGTEYKNQRSGFRHYIYLAQQLGITVTRDVGGGLIYEPPPYPFWQDDPIIQKVTRRNGSVRAGINRIVPSLERTRTMIAQNQFLLDELDAMQKPGYDPAQRKAALEKELRSLIETSQRLSRDLVGHEAVDTEQRWMLDYLQPS